MNSSRPIKVNCVDFSDEMRYERYLFRLLKENFDVQLSEDPDILLYSVFGQEFRQYDCLRVFITGENIRPNFDECDYAFSFDYLDDPRNYRFPEYACTGELEELLKPDNTDEIICGKTEFCNFIYSNRAPQERIRFFHLLSAYRKVDSLGQVLNNTPKIAGSGDRWNRDWRRMKLRLMAPYKFTIAFESSSYPGYTTEKLFHAMMCRSIPIYWGDPLVGRDFNPRSFINCHDYDSFEKVVERVIEVDQNENLYREILEEPYYADNRIPSNLQRENIVQRWKYIVDTLDSVTPVAQRRIPYFRSCLRKLLGDMLLRVLGETRFRKQIRRWHRFCAVYKSWR